MLNPTYNIPFRLSRTRSNEFLQPREFYFSSVYIGYALLQISPNFYPNSIAYNFHSWKLLSNWGGGGSKNSDVQEVARIDSFVNKNYTLCTCCAHFQVCTLNTHSNGDYFKVKQRAFC